MAIGGGLRLQAGALVEDELLRLTRAERPRVCFVGTAAAHEPGRVVAFYESFARRGCEVTHLELFGIPDDPLGRLADADLVYVSGGNTANMLALWRLHGIDVALRDAWERGAVLAGWSAGASCWFECFVTDSFGPELQPYDEGLGFLPGSFCPHFDSETGRRPIYERLVRKGFPPGYAADDDAAAVFGPHGFVEAVVQRPAARVYHVTAEGTERLPARVLQ